MPVMLLLKVNAFKFLEERFKQRRMSSIFVLTTQTIIYTFKPYQVFTILFFNSLPSMSDKRLRNISSWFLDF